MSQAIAPAGDDLAANLRALLDQVRCPVFLPGEPGYQRARAGLQTAVRHEPSVIVAARSAEDVSAAVAFAAAHDLPIAVQGTGHAIPVAADGGLLITTGRFTGVRVDAAERTAWLAAGTRWREVIDATAAHGLAPLNGSSPQVAAVPYLLGGGTGLLLREFGFAADRVRAIEVVTADGTIRTATATEEPELFWALRGGGGNFGVVTGIEVDLVEVSRVYGGGLFFDGSSAEQVVAGYHEWAASLPEELTSSIALFDYPDLPMIPEPIRGRYVAHVRVAYTGNVAEGERLVAGLRAIGPRLLDTVAELPYARAGEIYQEPEFPHAYLGNNVLLKDVPTEALRGILDIAGPAAPTPCIVELRHLGGASARAPEVPNAVGHRDAQYLLRILSPLTGTNGDSARRVHAEFFAAFAPWTTGRSVNFIYGDGTSTAEEVRACYEPADHERLASVKSSYDPRNLFRYNHNIAPIREHLGRRG